ncbi:MAG: nucleoside deaminase [Actinobacteria bacterium]|uniref:tRNA-specific adenosine deaminase 2 n=2 Tax=freshwater metagenome TaxID=449393 RepID=A0A6J6BGB3_9ZZZZ|nr:nucleoside deaminase [Actinomycetota bacterium]
MQNNEELMRLAIDVAKSATRTGDVPVGAIIINSDGVLIGRGFNEREANNDPTAHAEIVAIRNATSRLQNSRLDGCTLIVTLEPCAMCAGAIAQSRISKVIFGAWDEKAGAVGSIWDVLRDPRSIFKVEVSAGVLEDECAELLTDFFRDK